MQVYRRGAPPNFRVDPPAIVTGTCTYEQSWRAGNAISFAEVCGTSISGEGYALSKCLSLYVGMRNYPCTAGEVK